MSKAKHSITVGSLGLVAEFFQVALSTVKQWRQQGAPGAVGAYDLKAIMQWHDARVDRRTKAYRQTDARLVGPVDAALERYRLACAAREDFRLDELGRRTVAIADARRGLSAVLSVLRTAGDRLRDRCGTDASNAWAEAVDDAERVVLSTLGEGGQYVNN